jgi:hypothetical protein
MLVAQQKQPQQRALQQASLVRASIHEVQLPSHNLVRGRERELERVRESQGVQGWVAPLWRC